MKMSLQNGGAPSVDGLVSKEVPIYGSGDRPNRNDYFHGGVCPYGLHRVLLLRLMFTTLQEVFTVVGLVAKADWGPNSVVGRIPDKPKTQEKRSTSKAAPSSESPRVTKDPFRARP